MRLCLNSDCMQAFYFPFSIIYAFGNCTYRRSLLYICTASNDCPRHYQEEEWMRCCRLKKQNKKSPPKKPLVCVLCAAPPLAHTHLLICAFFCSNKSLMRPCVKLLQVKLKSCASFEIGRNVLKDIRDLTFSMANKKTDWLKKTSLEKHTNHAQNYSSTIKYKI